LFLGFFSSPYAQVTQLTQLNIERTPTEVKQIGPKVLTKVSETLPLSLSRSTYLLMTNLQKL